MKKSFYRVIAVYFLIIMVSCSGKQPEKISYIQPRKEVCTTDSLNGYHYIIPENSEGKIPLIVALDPHGNGMLAVQNFRNAVSYIPFVVIGSDLIRNNYADYISAIQQIIEDACNKLNADPDQVFLAGFSGGARMAFEYALRNRVKGVLMCGAGPSQDPAKLPFRLYMIAGTTDFNFSELYYNPILKKSGQLYFTDFFRGKHEWPSPALLEDGLFYLTSGSTIKNNIVLKHKSSELCRRADSLEQSNDSFLALKTLEKALLFDAKNRNAGDQFTRLSKTGNSQIVQLEKYLTLESRLFSAYNEAVMTHDSAWWFHEIKQLDLKTDKSNGDEKDHYLRIRAFLGILFYSRLNMIIHREPGNSRIIHLLAAYRNLEPQNPDGYYFLALHSLHTGNKQKAKDYLSRSVRLGFDDQVKLKEFPDDFINTL